MNKQEAKFIPKLTPDNDWQDLQTALKLIADLMEIIKPLDPKTDKKLIAEKVKIFFETMQANNNVRQYVKYAIVGWLAGWGIKIITE